MGNVEHYLWNTTPGLGGTTGRPRSPPGSNQSDIAPAHREPRHDTRHGAGAAWVPHLPASSRLQARATPVAVQA